MTNTVNKIMRGQCCTKSKWQEICVRSTKEKLPASFAFAQCEYAASHLSCIYSIWNDFMGRPHTV